jgi:hypothetical protein
MEHALRLSAEGDLALDWELFEKIASLLQFNAAFIAEFGNNESDSLLVLHSLQELVVEATERQRVPD